MNDDDLKEMNIHELGDAMIETMDSIQRIKSQIDKAKSEAILYKRYADADWFRRVNDALRHKQVRHQKILQLRGIMAREERREKQFSVDRAFVDAARILLSKEEFLSIVDLSKQFITE